MDSEVEDRVDGVKSWLSKNKGSSKTLLDEGSLKTPRLVQSISTCLLEHLPPRLEMMEEVSLSRPPRDCTGGGKEEEWGGWCYLELCGVMGYVTRFLLT